MEQKTPTTITAEEYIATRLTDQINWYNSKSSLMKSEYLKYKNLEIWIASSIPVIVSLSATEGMGYKFFGENVKEGGPSSFFEALSIGLILQILAALSGIFIVVIAKKVELNEYYALWKQYRATADSLTREKLYFLAQVGDYDDCDDETRFKRFVDRCESIMNEEQGKFKFMNVVSATKKQERVEKEDED
jgi:hypothetical protein